MTPRVMVEAVEYPVDRFPRHYQRYALWGDIIALTGDDVPDGSSAYIYYGKLHTLDASTSTIPARFENLVAAGAGGYAAMAWAAYAINRVNTGGMTPREFLSLGNQTLALFRTELKRLGRRNRVRIRQLYTP